ncbi:hypothetical protein MRX96_032956 [Rhipicephalus microplus]
MPLRTTIIIVIILTPLSDEPSVRLLPNPQRPTFFSSFFQPYTMATPFQSIRSALPFWMRRRRRNDESSWYSEQDWWPLSYNAKFRRRTPPSSSRSSGQW